MQPVYQEPADQQFYFWDETWSTRYGPWPTRPQAEQACSDYAATLDAQALQVQTDHSQQGATEMTRQRPSGNSIIMRLVLMGVLTLLASNELHGGQFTPEAMLLATMAGLLLLWVLLDLR
jgi:hypothetical protein